MRYAIARTSVACYSHGMKSRRNPLPDPTPVKRGRSSSSTIVLRENKNAPVGLLVFLGVVLGRLAAYYNDYSIEGQDEIETALEIAERWALYGDEQDREYLLQFGSRGREMQGILFKENYTGFTNNRWTKDADANYSFWSIVTFMASVLEGEGRMDAAMRHAASLIRDAKTRANDIRLLFPTKGRPRWGHETDSTAQAIAALTRGILSKKKFPREMLVGLDPERTNAVLYEALLRRER